MIVKCAQLLDNGIGITAAGMPQGLIPRDGGKHDTAKTFRDPHANGSFIRTAGFFPEGVTAKVLVELDQIISDPHQGGSQPPVSGPH
jgi:hypothetical protein